MVGGDGTWKGEQGKKEKKLARKEERAREMASRGEESRGIQSRGEGIGLEMNAVENAGPSVVEKGVGVSVNEGDENTTKKFKRIFSDKRLYSLAMFLLLYVGLEVGD